MKYIAIIVLLLISLIYTTSVIAKPLCKTNPVYCKIIKVQPQINKKLAMTLSNHIAKYAKQYKIDPNISIAIIQQESSFHKQHTWKSKTTIEAVCDKQLCRQREVIDRSIVDMSIVQINYRTAKDYNLDIKKLYNHDLEYAIESHMKILKSKMRICKDLKKEAWSCYHSKTPKYRKKYVELVKRYL